EDMREFYLAVDSLKEKFRTVFLLRFDHGMQYSQISSILDCPERTAKWRMQKAVEKIVDRLKSRNVV
ncbi:MAG: RNA polymerase sigma-70 factor, partial [Spirochaetes bacterium]|nr:RNA polymerase sigma-70 factor [Spirochaetota bacterium]